MRSARFRSGFSLIEGMLAVAMLSMLVAVAIIAVNPARQRMQANNAQRRQDVNAILAAVSRYAQDHNGAWPWAAGQAAGAICRSGITGANPPCVDLTALTVDGKYLNALPVDPDLQSSTSTGYAIAVDASAQVIVSAPDAELGAKIAVAQ